MTLSPLNSLFESIHPRLPETARPALRAQGLGLAYRHEPSTAVLKDINLEVKEREFVSIIGPSGCGKTTLLRLMAGVLSPTSGAMQVLGDSPVSQRKAGNIGFVFQRPVLLPWRDLLGNVTLPLDYQPSAADAGRPTEALRAVGLEKFAHYYPHQISGGMQQRVSLARALVHAPKLLLLDEPFGALDEPSRLEMDELVIRLHAQGKFTGLLVTHSIQEAIYLADRVVVLSARPGTVVEEFSINKLAPSHSRSREVLDDPDFLRYVKCLRDLLSAGHN